MTSLLDHEEIQELLGVYAVDAIENPDERRVVARHLAICDECSHEVAENLEALTRLTEERPVPDAVWAGIRDAVGSNVVDLASRRPRTRRIATAAAGVTAIAAAVAIALTMSGGGAGDPVRSAAVVPAAQSSPLSGQVELFAPESAAGRLVVDLRNVPEPPADHHYAVWVLRPGDDVEMEPVGVFTPDHGAANLDLRLPGPGEYVAVDISVQENDGPPEHSGTSLAGASLA